MIYCAKLVFLILQAMSKKKSLFKSKSAFVGFVTSLLGLVGIFAPSLAPWIKTHSSELLAGIGPLVIFLRLVTEDAVSLFPEL